VERALAVPGAVALRLVAQAEAEAIEEEEDRPTREASTVGCVPPAAASSPRSLHPPAAADDDAAATAAGRAPHAAVAAPPSTPAPHAPPHRRCTAYLANEVRCTATHAAFLDLAGRLFSPLRQLGRRDVGPEVADGGVLVFVMRLRPELAAARGPGGPQRIVRIVRAFQAEAAAAMSAAL